MKHFRLSLLVVLLAVVCLPAAYAQETGLGIECIGYIQTNHGDGAGTFYIKNIESGELFTGFEDALAWSISPNGEHQVQAQELNDGAHSFRLVFKGGSLPTSGEFKGVDINDDGDILFGVSSSGFDQVYLIKYGAKKVTRLGEGIGPTWGTEGAYYFTASNGLGRWFNGKRVGIYLSDGYSASESPDGRFMLFTTESNDGALRLYDVRTGHLLKMWNDRIYSGPHWMENNLALVTAKERDNTALGDSQGIYVLNPLTTDSEAELVFATRDADLSDVHAMPCP